MPVPGLRRMLPSLRDRRPWQSRRSLVARAGELALPSDSVAEAIALGHQAQTAQEFLRAGCGLLARRIGGDALLGIHQPANGGWSAEHAQAVPAEILQRLQGGWADYGVELAPVFEVARRTGCAVDSQVLGSRFTRSRYYREIAAPQRAAAAAIIVLEVRERVLGAFILGRRRGFSAQELRVLQALSPALALGLASLAKSSPFALSCDSGPEPVRLTPREQEIAEYVALGYTNQQIGIACGIAATTVRNRLAALFERLQVASRAELVSRLGNAMQARSRR